MEYRGVKQTIRYHRVHTALRDIVDVLYDGYCDELSDEELVTTITKKIKSFDSFSKRECRYKMLKIMNILKSTIYSFDGSCELYDFSIVLMLNHIFIMCKNAYAKVNVL